ncbi:hypothetical protein MTO96_002519 [Rhipicephalus appendiculatus]
MLPSGASTSTATTMSSGSVAAVRSVNPGVPKGPRHREQCFLKGGVSTDARVKGSNRPAHKRNRAKFLLAAALTAVRVPSPHVSCCLLVPVLAPPPP